MNMKRVLQTWVTIKPWLIGVLLSTIAMELGYGWGSSTAALLGGEPGIWARLGKGFVWGAVIAGLQWPIVRAAGVRPFRFIAASAVCFAAGYPGGQTIQLIFVSLNMHWTGYWLAVAAFGLFLGVPQWWIFRRRMHSASLWIVISVAGWMLAGLEWIHYFIQTYGIVTGAGLVWLARSRPPQREELS